MLNSKLHAFSSSVCTENTQEGLFLLLIRGLGLWGHATLVRPQPPWFSCKNRVSSALLAVLLWWGLATCVWGPCVSLSLVLSRHLFFPQTRILRKVCHIHSGSQHLLPQPVGTTPVPFHFSFPLVSPHLSCQHQDELPGLCVDWGLLLLGGLSNTWKKPFVVLRDTVIGHGGVGLMVVLDNHSGLFQCWWLYGSMISPWKNRFSSPGEAHVQLHPAWSELMFLHPYQKTLCVDLYCSRTQKVKQRWPSHFSASVAVGVAGQKKNSRTHSQINFLFIWSR